MNIETVGPFGIPFVVARSKYMVRDYHTKLLQMINALELANLSISDNSRTSDDFYSPLKSDFNN